MSYIITWSQYLELFHLHDQPYNAFSCFARLLICMFITTFTWHFPTPTTTLNPPQVTFNFALWVMLPPLISSCTLSHFSFSSLTVLVNIYILHTPFLLVTLCLCSSYFILLLYLLATTPRTSAFAATGKVIRYRTPVAPLITFTPMQSSVSFPCIDHCIISQSTGIHRFHVPRVYQCISRLLNCIHQWLAWPICWHTSNSIQGSLLQEFLCVSL